MQTKFIYPTSRQFPMDAVCFLIVKALEERQWQFPGIKVEFDIYGNGKYQQVDTITGSINENHFLLEFSRIQVPPLDSLTHNKGAVTRINIPGKELHVRQDELGLTLYVYVGPDQTEERNAFIELNKEYARMRERDRFYLKYKGSNRHNPKLPGNDKVTEYQRPLYLNFDMDDREYQPEGEEPQFFSTEAVLKVFTEWLKKNVLNYITKISTL